MELNFEANELELLVFKTIKNNLNLTFKYIRENNKRKDLNTKDIYNLLIDYENLLEDYLPKDVKKAIDKINEKKDGHLINITKEAEDLPDFFKEFSDFIKSYELMNSYALDIKNLQYYKYDKNFNYKSAVSDEEYDVKLKAYLSEYNRKLTLYRDDDGKPTLSKFKFDIGDISNIYNLNIMNSEQFNKKKIIEEVIYDGSTTTEEAIYFLQDVAKKMFIPKTIKGFNTINYRKVFSFVFMHWIWQVKRNLLDLKTDNEIFLILFSSKQGTGKSTFINNLISCIGQKNIASKSPKDITDPREAAILEKLVLFFDEINEQGTNTCMATLKKMITTENINQRRMYTTKHTDIKRKFSGIAGANVEINDYFGDDDSGHRRFFEIRLDDDQGRNHIELPKLRTDPLFKKLWNIVDENKIDGYINEDCEVWNDLKSIQSTYKKNNTIDMYFDDYSKTFISKDVMNITEIKVYCKKNTLELTKISLKNLYENYKCWCKENDKTPYNKNNFEKTLTTKRALSYDKSKGVNVNTGQTRYTRYYYLIEHIDEVECNEDAFEKLQHGISNMGRNKENVDKYINSNKSVFNKVEVEVEKTTLEDLNEEL